MVHVQVRGIECDFDETAVNDFRMMGLLTRMKRNEQDYEASWDFVCRFFGEEQLERILDELEDTSTQSVLRFIQEATEEAAKVKGEDSKN